MQSDLTFFTNEPGPTLLDRFKKTLRDVKFFDILVGYFRNSGFLEYKLMYVIELPVFPATDAQKAPIIEHVRKILADHDSPAVPRLEAEIDKMVYGLYNLTSEEIALVEGNIL
jgi:hypothetical protein